MADEAKQEEEGGKGGGKLRLVIFALVGLLVLGGGGAGVAWFLGFFGGDGGEGAVAAETEDGEKAAAAAEEKGGEKPAAGEEKSDGGGAGEGSAEGVYFVDLPDILVNLRSSGRRMRYLKLKAVLEVVDPETAGAVRGLTPRVMDSIQLYLRSLTVEDVRGALGMEKLKEEMLARINRAIRPHRVEDVLFKEMLVQ